MATDDELTTYRNAYEHKTNAELIHEVQRWNQSSPQHIAAKQLLELRRLKSDQEKEEKEAARHSGIDRRLEELKTPHWTVLPNFWLTMIGAVAAVVAAYFAWLALKK